MTSSRRRPTGADAAGAVRRASKAIRMPRDSQAFVDGVPEEAHRSTNLILLEDIDGHLETKAPSVSSRTALLGCMSTNMCAPSISMASLDAGA